MPGPLHTASKNALDVIVALIRDEGGSATLEYCAAGGVLSGLIFWAFQVLKDAQTAALDRALENVGY